MVVLTPRGTVRVSPLSRSEVREVDRRAIEEYGLPGIVLMENAGREVARRLMSMGTRGQVVIACGKGNNGGDGFVIARHLENHGVDVHVLLFASLEDVSGDAATNLDVLQRAGTPLTVLGDDFDPAELAEQLREADLIVDALLGTGTKGHVRPPFDKVIESINASAARVVAIDLPSGLDADLGVPLGATIYADRTFTMVAPKLGFANPDAADFVGTVEVVDIGVPRRLLEEFDVPR